MRNRLISIIKRWPWLYHCATKVYWTFYPEHVKEILLGTRARERYWSERQNMAEGYWANRNLPITHFVADRISKLASFRSILEVGCASGPNLYQLGRKFPEAQITGIDINRETVQYGNAQFAREGMANVRLSVGRADELGEYQDKIFDIVFTNAVLIYIGPDKIRDVVQGMLRITRRAILLVELYHPNADDQDPLGLGVYKDGYWVRDYAALFRPFVAGGRISIAKIPEDVWPGEPWRALGYIIEVLV